MKLTASWDIAPCGLVWVDRRFRGAYFLQHWDGRPRDGDNRLQWRKWRRQYESYWLPWGWTTSSRYSLHHVRSPCNPPPTNTMSTGALSKWWSGRSVELMSSIILQLALAQFKILWNTVNRYMAERIVRKTTQIWRPWNCPLINGLKVTRTRGKNRVKCVRACAMVV
jgi:hypothetical protein